MAERKRLGKLAAAATALALLGVGITGLAANAAPDPAANIDGDATGSVIVHKYDGTPGEAGDGTVADTSNFGNSLAGVEFTLRPITLTNPLTTSEGWAEVEALTPPLTTGLGAAVTQTTDASGTVTFGGLPVGAYYVEETASGPNLITAPVVPFIVTVPHPNDGGWLYDVNVYPKNKVTTTEATKTAENPTGTAQTGDKIDWTISVPVPKLTDDYSEFEIVDTPGAGLAIDSWGEISIDGTPLDSGDWNAVNGTVTLTDTGLDNLNAALNGVADGESVSVTATLTTTVTGQGTFENEATITINGVTLPPPSGKTNWGGITVTKISGENAEATLEGAEFELFDGKNGTLIGAAKVTDADGTLSYTVWVGNDDVTTRDGLYLKETVAPAGHVLPADPWTAVGTVTADADTSVEVTVENYKPEGPDLPLTGAQGTLLFTILGLALMTTGAVTVVVRKKRATN